MEVKNADKKQDCLRPYKRAKLKVFDIEFTDVIVTSEPCIAVCTGIVACEGVDE